MLLKIFLFLSIPIAVGLVYLVKVKFNDNQRKYLKWSLWVFIGLFSYLTISSISDVIKFDEIKNNRYQYVIKNLKDIRDSQLAHRTIHGHFEITTRTIDWIMDNASTSMFNNFSSMQPKKDGYI